MAILYGKHPVFEALNNPNRKIEKLLSTKENLEELKGKINSGLIKIVDRKEIDKLLPQNAVHQGLLLYASDLEEYDIEEICQMAEGKDKAYVLILDQVTDPQNIGAIIRSCVAFNCLALIMQEKHSPQETGAMAKSSVGMIEHLPICRVTNLSRAIQQLQKSGFWTVGMDGYAKTTVDKINKSGKTAIVMGSEGKGMRRLVSDNCDMTIRLDINPQVESLNVSTAAAIVLYEMNK